MCEAVPVQAMQKYRKSRGTAPLILNLSTPCRWVVIMLLQIVCPRGKNPWYPLNKRSLYNVCSQHHHFCKYQATTELHSRAHTAHHVMSCVAAWQHLGCYICQPCNVMIILYLCSSPLCNGVLWIAFQTSQLWLLSSSGLLYSKCWYSFTDISSQPTSPIFKGHTGQ